MPHRVLVVEDEIGLRVAVQDSLNIAGYEVETADDGQRALELASQGRFDLIVLDLLLPQKDGMEVCKELRSAGIDTPVVMLTVKSDLEDRIRGFAMGADDYVTKPFDHMELIARIRAVLRRTLPLSDNKASDVHAFGDVLVDTTRAAVWRANKRLALSAKEYQLLLYFVTHPRQTLTRALLMKAIWYRKLEPGTRIVDVHVGWLRRKIEEDPAHPSRIRTIYGQGYQFAAD